jgi:hypothetical protein
VDQGNFSDLDLISCSYQMENVQFADKAIYLIKTKKNKEN